MAGTPDTNIEYTAWLAPSCPDGTAATAYKTTAVPVLATTLLWKWNVRIPPGHGGVTGIALVDGGSFIIPYANPGPGWLIGDDDDLTFPYGKQLGSTVSVAYYNTSTLYTHGWQCRFIFTPLSALTVTNDVIVTPNLAGLAQDIEATTGGT
jgi:hypothetical protein